LKSDSPSVSLAASRALVGRPHRDRRAL